MYKTLSENLQRSRRKDGARLPKGGKGIKRRRAQLRVASSMRGVVVRVIGGRQEIKLIGRSVVKSSLYLDGVGAAKGARSCDEVRLYYNRGLGLWCGTLLSRLVKECDKKEAGKAREEV